MTAKHPRAASLRMMLEMLVEHRRKRDAAAEPGEIEVVNFSSATPIPPRWVSHVEHAKKDAVAASLHAVIREEGWRSYAAAGLDDMHALSDAATQDSDLLASILDHRWDGIGVEGRGWWVA